MKHPRRALSLFLALTVLCALLAPAAQARETHFFQSFPDPVPEEAQVWERADPAVFNDIRDTLKKAAGQTGNEDQVLTLCGELMMTYQYMYHENIFCMLDYYRDPGAYAADYMKWNNTLVQANSDLLSTLQEVLRSEYGPALTRELGMSYAASLLNASAETPEQLKLLERETELVDAYWTAVNQAYRVEVGGKTWTEAALLADESLSEEDYLAVSLALSKARNEAAAPILTDLVKLRNRYAVSKGYDNYADYAYEAVYARDFTPADATALHAAVKAEIVPLERELALPMSYNPSLSDTLLSGLNGQTQEEMLDAVAPYMAEVSDEYAAVYDYMRTYGLCDIGPLDTKLNVGFTTDLPLFASAYLFNAPSGNYYDVKTLIHEFGHYANYCLAYGSASLCYDVAEIHSQGLEALYLTFADGLAGAAGGDAYRAVVLNDLVASVTEGCLYDEFQQAIYVDGGMTASEMNRLFRTLSEAYGYVYGTDGDEAYDWVRVNHTFESPFYYVSYATSALTALEILDLSAEDFNAAADTYLALTAQTGVEGYRAAVKEAGLSDIFQPGTVAAIAGGLRDYAGREVYNLPAFSDLEGHWAAGSARLASACGLFQGDQAGNFLPDGTMTRSALVTTLWRLTGSPEAQTSASFADVAPGAWYADAVEWAASSGVAAGTGAGFDPDGAMTREQFAAMLYRYAGSPAPEGAGLSGYADAPSVSGWAADAVAWAVEEGILTGKPGGRLDPAGSASRAEAAVMLSRYLES